VGREFGTYGLEAFLEPRAILERVTTGQVARSRSDFF
jgi:hypothetical protein